MVKVLFKTFSCSKGILNTYLFAAFTIYFPSKTLPVCITLPLAIWPSNRYTFISVISVVLIVIVNKAYHYFNYFYR